MDPLWILVAFALSFSSTVFAVKVLEGKGEMSSLHGRVAIGVLIMQNIFAVLFLTVSTGKPRGKNRPSQLNLPHKLSEPKKGAYS